MAEKTKNADKKTAEKSKVKTSKYDFASGRDYVFNFIKEIIDRHGPRLPGSEEERAASYDIEKYMEEATGKKVIREPFKVSPVASIGAIPLLGIAGFVFLLLYYVNPIISLILSALGFGYAIIQIFMYKGWFDGLWPRKDSQNLYSVIDGGERIDYTLVFSGHMDSSWNWNHSINKPQFLIIKIVYFILSVLAVMVFSLISIIKGNTGFFEGVRISSAGDIVMNFVPLLFVPGLYYGATFLSWDKTKASPGAMDNLSGVGAALFMGKFYKENPDKLPKNCRIIIAAFGSEEAGLKGSIEFCKAHKDDKELLVNPIVINIDSLSDYDHFGVVTGDVWQMTNFDPLLIEMATDVFKSMGLKTKAFKNPVGGCDSTPFCNLGIPTVTLCAQNPVPTDYYHTSNDTYERLDKRSIEKGIEAITILAEKLHKRQAEKKQ